MKHISWPKIFLSLTMLIIILLATPHSAHPVTAQSGSGYDLTWNSIDAGGGTSAGGIYTLVGTIGQADTETMSGGVYTLEGGFWVDFLGNRVMLPLIQK